MKKKLAQIGDVNLIDHDGGFIFEEDDRQFIEWCSRDEDVLTLYRVDVPSDVFGYHDWAKVEDIAQFVGGDFDLLRKQSTSENVLDRAMLIVDLASYHGWGEVDHEPLTMTEADLTRLWFPEEVE